MYGLMNGPVLLSRSFESQADAEAWAHRNSKGRGGYKVVPVRQSGAGLILDVYDNPPPDTEPLIKKWLVDAKKVISPEDLYGYRQGLVDAARICEMMGASEGCAETILAISRGMAEPAPLAIPPTT